MAIHLLLKPKEDRKMNNISEDLCTRIINDDVYGDDVSN